MTPELHRQLRALLADLYPTRADLTRVAQDAGIPLAAVTLGSSALNDWDAVLHEAIKQQLTAALLDGTQREQIQTSATSHCLHPGARFRVQAMA